MSDINNGGCFVLIIWGITILISIGAGVMTYNWIEPKSFLGIIGFLILWGVLSKIGHFLAIGLIALISEKS